MDGECLLKHLSLLLGLRFELDEIRFELLCVLGLHRREFTDKSSPLHCQQPPFTFNFTVYELNTTMESRFVLVFE